MSTRSTPPPRGRRGELITGRLQDHGRAKYQFEADGSPSYYVRVVTARGVETLWGTDLERAVAQSKTQPKVGALVGVRRVGADLVTIPPRDGERTTEQQRTFRRARWVVEGVAYFAQAAQRANREVQARLEDRKAMAERPELRSAFVSLGIARAYAEQHIRDPRDRELFVTRVKAVMEASVQHGRPAPEPRQADRGHRPTKPVPGRDEPTR